MKIPAALPLAFILFAQIFAAFAESPSPKYKVVKTEKVGGDGAYDYVCADSSARKLYVPRGDQVTVYDLDSLKLAGAIPNCKGARGVAIDPTAHHGFSSSSPVVMWDTQSLTVLKTIPVDGKPDSMFFDPATQRVFVFSHEAPNATVLDSTDGTILGTIDLQGEPEQAVSDGAGRVYVNLEDRAQVAVIDAKSLKVTGRYDFSEKGKTATGLAIDAKNRILFACTRNPSLCVILSADDGKILSTLPIGKGCDGAVFNPATREAFTSQRDGTLTVIEEKSPAEFVVEQTVETKAGAKTCTLDNKTNQIFLITADRLPPPSQPAATTTTTTGNPPKKERGQIVPDSFTILVVGL